MKFINKLYSEETSESSEDSFSNLNNQNIESNYDSFDSFQSIESSEFANQSTFVSKNSDISSDQMSTSNSTSTSSSNSSSNSLLFDVNTNSSMNSSLTSSESSADSPASPFKQVRFNMNKSLKRALTQSVSITSSENLIIERKRNRKRNTERQSASSEVSIRKQFYLTTVQNVSISAQTVHFSFMSFIESFFKNIFIVHASFSNSTHKKDLEWTLKKIIKIHRADLPAPSENWNEMRKHLYAKKFLKTSHKKWNEISSKNAYKIVKKSQRKQILSLRWVFIYKFDDHDFLIKFKARICVREDLQLVSKEDTRAVTFAVRSLRSLLTIAAAFDLNIKQLNEINVFINSKLSDEIYTYLSDSVAKLSLSQFKFSCLQLLQALYELRKFPLLWLNEFSSTLTDLEFKPVSKNRCLFTNDRLIVFFHVNDIVILSHKDHHEKRDELIKNLMTRYEIRDMRELEWFLNIRIVRDRTQRKIWLSQNAYIDKIVNKYNLTHAVRAATPLTDANLFEFINSKFEIFYIVTSQEIFSFQSSIESLIYSAVITRPDVAAATSCLTSFLSNSTLRHSAEADHVICYLRDTKYLFIQYFASNEALFSFKNEKKGTEFSQSLRDGKIFEVASDAAFEDFKDSRRSTESYLFKLFDDSIDWKSTKQRTVSTSIIETELLSLSHVDRESFWWKRFFSQLEFNSSHELTLLCDNTQIVRIMNKESLVLKINLRHLDIHQHWLREQVQVEKTRVKCIKIANMSADELIKHLDRQQHEESIQQLEMIDIRDRISFES